MEERRRPAPNKALGAHSAYVTCVYIETNEKLRLENKCFYEIDE